MTTIKRLAYDLHQLLPASLEQKQNDATGQDAEEGRMLGRLQS
jgi:hypothetical protein